VAHFSRERRFESDKPLVGFDFVKAGVAINTPGSQKATNLAERILAHDWHGDGFLFVDAVAAAAAALGLGGRACRPRRPPFRSRHGAATGRACFIEIDFRMATTIRRKHQAMRRIS